MSVLSSGALQAMMAESTGETFLVLVTLSHPSLATPVRVTSDSVNTVSNGNTFVPWPFQLTLALDDPKQPPTARVTIDAVDQTVSDALRDLPSAANIEIQIVTGSTPDTVEMSTGQMWLRNVVVDALTVTGDLSYDNNLNEQYPGRLVTPRTLPGVFAMEEA